VPWSAEAAEVLATARASERDLHDYRAQVNSGAAQLWQFPHTKPTYLLIRLERYSNGDQDLVLVAGAGINTRAVIQWASDLAHRNNLNLRAHITRPGFVRLLQNNGWHQSEIVMRREHGQQ
jgi:hypothetical protein